MCTVCLSEVCKKAKRDVQQFGKQALPLWRKKHQDMRQQLGMSSCLQSTRAADLILTAEAAVADTTELFTDLSQCASRRPWSRGIRSVNTSSCVYSHEAKRTLHPIEVMRALGFPKSTSIQGLSTAALQDLIGESMSLPAVVTAVLALLVACKKQTNAAV